MPTNPALAGLATQVALIGISLIAPDDASPWPRPDSPQWTVIHRSWLAGLLLSLFVLAGASTDTHPARSRSSPTAR